MQLEPSNLQSKKSQLWAAKGKKREQLYVECLLYASYYAVCFQHVIVFCPYARTVV